MTQITYKDRPLVKRGRKVVAHGDTALTHYYNSIEVMPSKDGVELHLRQSTQKNGPASRWHTVSAHITISYADWEHLKSAEAFVIGQE